MALDVKNIITYDDMFNYVVEYIKYLYDNRNSIIIPTVSSKSDSQSQSWDGYTGKNQHPQAGQGYSSASISMGIEYNTRSNISPIDENTIRNELRTYLSNYATDINGGNVIISKTGEIINFQFIMNFFNVIIKFINKYFLTYTLTSDKKEYIPTNYTNNIDVKLNHNADLSSIMHDILNVDDKWILKSTFSSSVSSSSSCSSSSSSSSSCSSSSSSSFITYLNIN